MGKKKGWRDSEAKKLLKEDLANGTIPLNNNEMDATDVYLSRVEFTEFEFERFRDNLRTLRTTIKEKKRLAREEKDALEHDRLLFPKNPFNTRGEPRWEGSQAERHLKHDINQGHHEMMKPRILWESRAAYQEFPLKVFRKHIYQEVRTRKWRAYLASKQAS